MVLQRQDRLKLLVAYTREPVRGPEACSTAGTTAGAARVETRRIRKDTREPKVHALANC